MSLLSNVWRFVRAPKTRYYALHELDRQLERYLDFDGGVFVEAGANDGVRQSNTYYFERHRGWSGLLVEAIPELAARCRRNRRAAIVEQAALVPFGYPDELVELQYCDLMSTVKGAMKSDAEEAGHIQRGCDCQKIETRSVTAPAATLTSLLQRHGLQHVDLFSLDVEGFELPVLQGLDFDRFAPRFLLVEARYRDEIDSFLASRYETLAELSHHDVLYGLRAAAA